MLKFRRKEDLHQRSRRKLQISRILDNKVQPFSAERIKVLQQKNLSSERLLQKTLREGSTDLAKTLQSTATQMKFRGRKAFSLQQMDFVAVKASTLDELHLLQEKGSSQTIRYKLKLNTLRRAIAREKILLERADKRVGMAHLEIGIRQGRIRRLQPSQRNADRLALLHKETAALNHRVQNIRAEIAAKNESAVQLFEDNRQLEEKVRVLKACVSKQETENRLGQARQSLAVKSLQALKKEIMLLESLKSNQIVELASTEKRCRPS